MDEPNLSFIKRIKDLGVCIDQHIVPPQSLGCIPAEANSKTLEIVLIETCVSENVVIVITIDYRWLHERFYATISEIKRSCHRVCCSSVCISDIVFECVPY